MSSDATEGQKPKSGNKFRDIIAGLIYGIKSRLHSNKATTWLFGTFLLVSVPLFVFAAQQPLLEDSPEPKESSQNESVLNETDNNYESGGQSSSSTATEGQASNTSNTDVDITVNGESIPVPESGVLHETYTSNNSEVTVDINVSGDSSSNSSTIIDIDSFHSSTGKDKSEDSRRNLNDRHDRDY